MISVVYLAHGPKRLVDTAVFSALTLTAGARGIDHPWRLVVYTDRPERFTGCGLECETPPLARLREHSGVDYPHRLKILALRDCARHYEGGILYVDGDTYFRSSPEPLFARLSPTTSLLHTREYSLSEDLRPELHRIVRTGAFDSPILRGARSQPDLAMWNAGTVGIDAANTRLIDDVLASSDELYGAYAYHIVEQFSWSLGLAQATGLEPADDVIAHYWAGREQVIHEVVTFLHRNRRLTADRLASEAFNLRPEADPSWSPPLRLHARNLARRGRTSMRELKGRFLTARSPRPTTNAAALAGPERDHARERARASAA